MKYLLPILLLIALPVIVSGQDQAQYNHYISNQGILNPAYNGTRDVISGLIVSRNQWLGMSDAPMNQAINVHGPIEDTNLGVGVVLENDRLGFSNNFNFMAAGSYKLQMGRRDFLALGLQLGVTSNVYDGTKAITQDYGDPVFDGKQSLIGFNFGIGAYYYAENYFAGFSIPRFFRPDFDEANENDGKFKNTVSFKDIHSYWYGGYIFDWGDVKVKPTALIRTVVGAPLTFDLSCNVLLNERIWLGAGYRSISEMVLLSEFIINRQWTVRYSFDYSLSKLGKYGQYGSHEIGLQFDFSFNKRAGMRSIRYF
ncbi:type IX secretion system membrane protein PorP/SprF [Carboxylicivirga mesophila]|uniref:Type IX secretion system membrane protein PorP/SprF n=2 Tax=Carboxylicivirga TaxID=1628153 RepID=A0A941F6N6_9BACT|nr:MULTISPECIES: type IX secretion system membrane protein PorP/SprF [Carboxylicivirga]MBR8537851.1 type IX secretion system membrane protein PorP/SprF [Carboxylicivirga sediminis]MBS2213786.1 type IX secretion system membrane protein PorP/SprF [Carboxylicivirga mesophila]